MSSLTKSKIAYDLKISPHRVVVDYGAGEKLEFIFSSELYKNKFLERYQEHREQIKNSLSNRFGIEIVIHDLADLRLYTTIEKRGFLIYKGPVEFECLNDITLDGTNQMSKR